MDINRLPVSCSLRQSCRLYSSTFTSPVSQKRDFESAPACELHSYPSNLNKNFTNLSLTFCSISLLYKKSLILSNDERGGRSQGDIVNLQSTDTIKLQDFCTYAQIGWSGFLQMAMGFVSLYKLLGWTVFVGIGVLFASIPVTATVMT